MRTVWRLNIKTAASEGIDPRQFCIERQLLGVGWSVSSESELDWDTYYRFAEVANYKKRYKGWWRAVNALGNRMKEDDLCWTRDLDGIYYLGRIAGPWTYLADQDHRSADVVNCRRCTWKKVGEVDAVPGKVVNSFRSGTVQAVNGESVLLYSEFLYNSVCDEPHDMLQLTLPSLTSSDDLFSLVSAEDCEDIVGLYLQEKGYRLIPSSCKADTAAYEFVLKHVESGRSAVAQVKQGSVDLVPAEYSAMPGEVYLFTSHGSYVGAPANDVYCIDPKELLNFVMINRRFMSDRIKTWITIMETLSNRTVPNMTL